MVHYDYSISQAALWVIFLLGALIIPAIIMYFDDDQQHHLH